MLRRDRLHDRLKHDRLKHGKVKHQQSGKRAALQGTGRDTMHGSERHGGRKYGKPTTTPGETGPRCFFCSTGGNPARRSFRQRTPW